MLGASLRLHKTIPARVAKGFEISGWMVVADPPAGAFASEPWAVGRDAEVGKGVIATAETVRRHFQSRTFV